MIHAWLILIVWVGAALLFAVEAGIEIGRTGTVITPRSVLFMGCFVGLMFHVYCLIRSMRDTPDPWDRDDTR